VVIFGWAFGLNLVWEVLHTVFYVCSSYIYTETLRDILEATIGDSVITLCLYGLGIVYHQKMTWIYHCTHRDCLFLMGSGVLLALLIEFFSIHIFDRWEYNALMPLIPGLGVGVTPVVQLALLPMATFFLTTRLLPLPLYEGRQ
jgi:hypothetical protein